MTPPRRRCWSTRTSCRSWRKWLTGCRRCGNTCCCTTARTSRPRVCRSNANTRKCWRRIRPSSSFRISTRTHERRRFTPPARPAVRKGCTSVTVSWCCTRSPSSRNMAATPSQGRIHRDDVYMPLTPMFHVHAWGSPYLYTMMGNKQVYPGRYAPDVLLGLIAREGVTSTHCVPTILQMLLCAPGSKDVDLSKLKMVVGGSAMPRALVRAALERGIDVFTGYGQSESCPMLSGVHLTTAQISEAPGGASRAARLRRSAGAAGRPAHRQRGHVRRAARRRDPRRDRHTRPLAHHGLSQRSCGVGAALGRRLPAHRRRGDVGRRRDISTSSIASRTSSRAAANGSRPFRSRTSSRRRPAS